MENKVELYTSRIENALSKANAYDTKLRPHALQLVGMSGLKNRIFMNNMIHKDSRYLEIGVWLGSTFISSLYDNEWDIAVAIDNFSEFNGTHEEFIKICRDHIHSGSDTEQKKFYFINSDCFKLTDEQKGLMSNMNVYFYDGGHSYQEQFDALGMYKNMMADTFVYIVDDWNHKPAQNGTRDAISMLNLKVHKEWELFNPNPDKLDDYFNWWNGLYVAILEKQ